MTTVFKWNCAEQNITTDDDNSCLLVPSSALTGICDFIRGLNFGTKVCRSSVKHIPQVFVVLVKHNTAFVDNISVRAVREGPGP